ncbi:sensor histidine kinase [Halomicrobium salinisoli]|uniref:sensor histidine kinase n=1 Tax=Halomicrobium salinisoli TaxID=2878391 RepID=UPI001CF0A649|nr:ATP-binding protein [Halomicrobium salinisoli]
MSPLTRFLRAVGGRRSLLALGSAYVLLAAAWPFVEVLGDGSFEEGVIVSILVGASGAVLLYGGYRLPETEIRPKFYTTIANWCFRAVGVMVGILLLIALVAHLNDPANNFLILPALAAVAGFAAGRHDARAKTRAYTLEQRNEALQETQAELEQAVDRLEASEERYRTVTENFPNGAVMLLDEDLRHTLVAGQGFEKVDISAEDLRGERVQDVYSGDALAVFEPNYRATLDGEPTTFEVEMQGRTFEARTHPLTDDDGVYAVLVMTQDVTERKERERALAKQALQQQVVADLGQLALETDDLDELMREASRQVADVLDTDYCEVLDLDDDGETFLLRQGVGWDAGLVGEATVPAVGGDSQAAYTLENDSPTVVADVEADDRFGGAGLQTDRGLRSGISTVVGPFDEPWGVLATHDADPGTFTDEDVSFVQSVANILAEAIERRQYQSELEGLVADLEESNERLEQFAYAASHDLQEPLRMISTYLQLIERRYEDELDEEGREFLEFAVDGADRMRSMVDGLLEYSRVETAADPLEPVELAAVLDDAREDLQMTIEASDATITADSLPRVEGDAHQLRQVFQNLLENAIEYSGDDPPDVHVSAERDGARWAVTVRDEGIGIDPGDQERVFDVFERAHGRDEGAGTGIGLALCQRIVERHGGEMWLDSEPGRGTAVSFTLPAVDE